MAPVHRVDVEDIVDPHVHEYAHAFTLPGISDEVEERWALAFERAGDGPDVRIHLTNPLDARTGTNAGTAHATLHHSLDGLNRASGRRRDPPNLRRQSAAPAWSGRTLAAGGSRPRSLTTTKDDVTVGSGLAGFRADPLDERPLLDGGAGTNATIRTIGRAVGQVKSLGSHLA